MSRLCYTLRVRALTCCYVYHPYLRVQPTFKQRVFSIDVELASSFHAGETQLQVPACKDQCSVTSSTAKHFVRALCSRPLTSPFRAGLARLRGVSAEKEEKLASSFRAKKAKCQLLASKQEKAACPQQCQTLCAFPV